MNEQVKETPPYRGSRKHVLDWVRSPGFHAELNVMIASSGMQVDGADHFMPTGAPGKDGVREARLERFLPDVAMRQELQRWWLAAPRGANTPNWDLAVQTHHEGRAALVLVEAKANIPELSCAGKGSPKEKDGRPPSLDSWRNHSRIALAITEAEEALNKIETGFSLSRDTHYQLSNRLAFGWKLASMGLPTVLLYLGFTGDRGLESSRPMLIDAPAWEGHFKDHGAGVMLLGVLRRWLPIGDAALMILVAARERIEDSPPLST